MIDRSSALVYGMDADQMAATIRKTRPAYDNLINTLAKLGTEVKRDRVLERDTIPPFNFVRLGIVELIFPPQELGEPVKTGGPIEGTLGQLVTEEVIQEYDEALVQGHLRVNYMDSGNMAEMTVVDVLGESVLSEEVLAAVDSAFAVYEQVEEPSQT